MPNIVKDGYNVTPSGEVTPRYTYIPLETVLAMEII